MKRDDNMVGMCYVCLRRGRCPGRKAVVCDRFIHIRRPGMIIDIHTGELLTINTNHT